MVHYFYKQAYSVVVLLFSIKLFYIIYVYIYIIHLFL